MFVCLIAYTKPKGNSSNDDTQLALAEFGQYSVLGGVRRGCGEYLNHPVARFALAAVSSVAKFTHQP